MSPKSRFHALHTMAVLCFSSHSSPICRYPFFLRRGRWLSPRGAFHAGLRRTLRTSHRVFSVVAAPLVIGKGDGWGRGRPSPTHRYYCSAVRPHPPRCYLSATVSLVPPNPGGGHGRKSPRKWSSGASRRKGNGPRNGSAAKTGPRALPRKVRV